jgi:thiol reductant ABC exporter CydD subunit
VKIDPRLLAWAHGVRPLLALTVALGVAAGICTVLQARSLSGAINGAFLGGQDLVAVAPLLLTLLLAGAGRALALWGSEAAAGRAVVQVKNDVRARLLAHIQRLGPAYVRGERTGELVNTVVEGVEALDAYYSQYLPQLMLAALVPLTFLLLIFPLDPVSGLVLLLTAPLIPLFMVLVGGLSDFVARKQWAALSRLSAHFLDVLQGLTTLKIFNRSRAQIETIALIGDRYRATTMGVLRVTFLSALILELVATLSTAVVAVEIGIRLLYGKMTFEQAFFVLILAPEFYLPLRLLGQRFHAGVAGLTAARRIFEVLETPAAEGQAEAATIPIPGSAQATTSAVASSPAGPPAGRSAPLTRPLATPPLLRFENVAYAYEDGRRPALRGVSFEIPSGQRTALVGPTGSGKTTIAQLLLRFIEVQAGMITVDRAPLAAWPVEAWRRWVAWVPQTPYLFYGTVADNIRLGRLDAGPEEVAWAASQAHAHDFIRTLPAGYDTPIGERGTRLSGGQAQRLALARAFLKDAPLVILDEATANLDPETEALVLDAAGRLLRGRTALVITHRLNTIAGADQILVLREGLIQESGSHTALLAQRGLYRRLVNARGDPGVMA